MRILFGNDRVKDGQQFVTLEGFEEDNLGSKVQYNTRTLMLDMPDPSTHSMASHNNNQVGKGRFQKKRKKKLMEFSIKGPDPASQHP